MHCPKFILDMLTEADNQTVCAIKFVGALGMFTFFGLSIADFVINLHFDYVKFGVGFGSGITSWGGAIWAKANELKKTVTV